MKKRLVQQGLVAGAFALVSGTIATAQDAPLSSIDWLSDSLATPAAAVAPRNEPGVANSASVESITVVPLDAPSPDGIGLIPRRQAGLPGSLWAGSDLDQLRRLIATLPVDPLPAQQDLIRLILLTELDPPMGAGPEGLLFQARVDALLARGALDEAAEMLERTGSNSPAIFQRAFDVALLQGHETAGCERLRETPGISPNFTTRIFCLARTGDWHAAALTLESARALGHVSEAEDALLAYFLDPELADTGEKLTAPAHPSPLEFLMFQAIGEGMPTNPLPLAFANADLSTTAGWKARIGAAERLARVGSLSPERLFTIYSERRPAASGGVWERVALIQSLDAALKAGDDKKVSTLLPQAWEAMAAERLEIPFATLFGTRLEEVQLTGQAGALAFRIGLLSDQYERLALTHPAPPGADGPFLAALAKGMPGEAAAPDALARAIADGFNAPALPESLSRPLADGRLGEAILQAMAVMESGTHGDLEDVTVAIGFLREVRLEEAARKYGLQLMLLHRRG